MKSNKILITLIIITALVYFWITLFTYHPATLYVVVIYFIILLAYLFNNLFHG